MKVYSMPIGYKAYIFRSKLFIILFHLWSTSSWQGQFIYFFCDSVNCFIYFEAMLWISIYTWLLYIPVMLFFYYYVMISFLLYNFFLINPILSDIKNSYFWFTFGFYLYSIYFSLYFQLFFHTCLKTLFIDNIYS